MKTRRLGSDGPQISVVGFGAWEAGGVSWGPNPADAQVIEAMTAAFDAGVNWVDTAETYGPHRSEELVGEALRGRDDVLVFTKVAPAIDVGGVRIGSGLDRAGVRAGAEGSLERLGRQVIDLYQIHFPLPDMSVEETWEAMAGLAAEGLVRYIGVSNFERELIERCEKIRHVDSVQPHLSMLHRDAQADVIPFCKASGIGVLCYRPLGSGLLTGEITEATQFPGDDWRAGRFPWNAHIAEHYFGPAKRKRHLEVVDMLRPIADRLGITLAQLALAWVIHQQGVTAAIAGSRSPSHTAENAAAAHVELDPKDLDEIEGILV